MKTKTNRAVIIFNCFLCSAKKFRFSKSNYDELGDCICGKKCSFSYFSLYKKIIRLINLIINEIVNNFC